MKSEVSEKAIYFPEPGVIKIKLIPTDEHKWAGKYYSTIKLHPNLISEEYAGRMMVHIPDLDENGNMIITEDVETMNVDIFTTTLRSAFTGASLVLLDDPFDNDLPVYYEVTLETALNPREYKWVFTDKKDAVTLHNTLQLWLYAIEQMTNEQEPVKETAKK